jgi:DnaJ-class molecular chaperone
VQVQVQSHRLFTRKGSDIISKLELKLSEALLGCRKDVETAWGTRSVHIPPGTTASSKIYLDGMGAPRLQGSGRGRHVLNISLAIPPHLTGEQLQAVNQLRRSGL